MSDYETVQVERHGAVAVVSLNRPDALNSFNAALRRDLLRAVRHVNGDPCVRVVVLTGEGRAFCAGADLAEKPSESDDGPQESNTENETSKKQELPGRERTIHNIQHGACTAAISF